MITHEILIIGRLLLDLFSFWEIMQSLGVFKETTHNYFFNVWKPCEIEYVAAIACTCHAIWSKILLKELHFEQIEATTIMMDNKSAIALAKNPVFRDRSKHIKIKYHFIQNALTICMWRLSIRSLLIKLLTFSQSLSNMILFKSWEWWLVSSLRGNVEK